MATEHSRSFRSLKAESVEVGLTKPSSSSDGAVVTDGFDVLNFIGFEWDVVSTKEIGGHFLVTSKTCQVCRPSSSSSNCFLLGFGFCRLLFSTMFALGILAVELISGW